MKSNPFPYLTKMIKSTDNLLSGGLTDLYGIGTQTVRFSDDYPVNFTDNPQVQIWQPDPYSPNADVGYRLEFKNVVIDEDSVVAGNDLIAPGGCFFLKVNDTLEVNGHLHMDGLGGTSYLTQTLQSQSNGSYTAPIIDGSQVLNGKTINFRKPLISTTDLPNPVYLRGWSSISNVDWQKLYLQGRANPLFNLQTGLTGAAPFQYANYTKTVLGQKMVQLGFRYIWVETRQDFPGTIEGFEERGILNGSGNGETISVGTPQSIPLSTKQNNVWTAPNDGIVKFVGTTYNNSSRYQAMVNGNTYITPSVSQNTQVNLQFQVAAGDQVTFTMFPTNLSNYNNYWNNTYWRSNSGSYPLSLTITRAPDPGQNWCYGGGGGFLAIYCEEYENAGQTYTDPNGMIFHTNIRCNGGMNSSPVLGNRRGGGMMVIAARKLKVGVNGLISCDSGVNPNGIMSLANRPPSQGPIVCYNNGIPLSPTMFTNSVIGGGGFCALYDRIMP